MDIKNNDRDFFMMGFSIIEMTVVLTVVALIAGTALSVSSSSRQHNNVVETREKINDIFKMMKRYTDAKNQLPCPADPSLVMTDQNFGVGTGSGNTPNPFDGDFVPPGSFLCTATLTAEESDNPGQNNGEFIMGGAVPVKTLGLPPTYALDSWGRRMHYAVDHNITWPGPDAYSGWGFLDRCVEGDIEVRRQAVGGPNYIQSPEAAVLIISHGPNGHGAWRAKGGSRILLSAAGNDEKENSYPQPNYDEKFVQKYTDSDSNASGGYFDDIVEYRTKWQFDPQYSYPYNETSQSACP